MARRAKEEAERTRTRILASALALFAKKGYAQTTFTDIAARLKLTKGAVYWHFASKEALLLALIDDMVARFGRLFAAAMPPGEASYPDVAALLARHTAQMLDHAEARAYFQLLHRQIQWTDSSMAAVRRDLLTNRRFGPWEAFRAALENDVRAGRARPGTDAAQIASVAETMIETRGDNMAEETNKKSMGAVLGSLVGTIVLGAACAVGGWVACEMWPKSAPQARAAAQGTVTVAVRAAEERPYNLPEKFVAHAEAEQEVDLLPQIDGYVKALKFKEGDLVKAGQVLYVIDDERYRAVVNQRKADLEAAEAEARRADRYFERMQKADARGITQLERDNAEAGAEKARASVLQAKANLVVAEYDLKKTTVVAPISGQIGKSSAYVGDYVAPSKGALARIVQIDPIRVSFPLTDRAYVAWRNAQLAGKPFEFRQRVVLPDGTLYNREGLWAYDDNTMSKETATITMRLSFPNPDRLLVPNTYVTLLVDSKKPRTLLCVPQQAVVDLAGGGRGVWVMKKDGTVEQRVVTALETGTDGWTPVTDGLAKGEQIVVSGVSKLRSGMKATIAQATPNADLDAKYKAPIKE